MALMEADTNIRVVKLLSDAGYWTDPAMWRYFGDVENNRPTIGNQQADAVAALAEKIVNGIDARLINACLVSGVDPAGSDAPQDMRSAVGHFFDPEGGDHGGRVATWSAEKTLAESLRLTLAATGNMPADGQPCLSIADAGEGQTPDQFPQTFMSLNKSNKFRIPFVQGLFNMGGTGAMQFCSKPDNLQLFVSRRNPKLVPGDSPERDRQWGFTVVRRELPAGNERSSFYSYLAPRGATYRDGNVLAFDAPDWPIFPDVTATARSAYARPTTHGTLVKLYEYSWRGTKSNIVRSGDGLLRRLDQMLPELALPVRLYECRREYRGHQGSHATNLTGLSARLERDRAEKLDDTIANPIHSVIDVGGRPIRVRVYAFRGQEAKEYRTSQNAILFLINGQTHAAFSQQFFTRAGVRLGYLADSLLVTLDCSAIEGVMREDLFMTSRDRLRKNDLSEGILDELEQVLRGDAGLRELQNRRRREEIDQKLADDKPLASAFQDVLRSDPTLERLFLTGQSISVPFGREGTGDGTSACFKGRDYPTFFRFHGRAQGDQLTRTVHLPSKPRIEFETDANNGYFDREIGQGEWAVYHIRDGQATRLESCRMDGPREGTAALHLALPEGVRVGDTLTVEVEVTDETRVDPLVSRALLKVDGPATGGGGGGETTRPVTHGEGTRGGSSHLGLPHIERVHRLEWGKSFHTFTDLDCLWVVRTPAEDNRDMLDFYVNVDNKYLRNALKSAGPKNGSPRLIETRFVYANVLIGMAMLNAAKSRRPVESNEEDGEGSADSTEDRIASVTTALAPIIVPMVDVLAKLSIDDVLESVGEAAAD